MLFSHLTLSWGFLVWTGTSASYQWPQVQTSFKRSFHCHLSDIFQLTFRANSWANKIHQGSGSESGTAKGPNVESYDRSLPLPANSSSALPRPSTHLLNSTSLHWEKCHIGTVMDPLVLWNQLLSDSIIALEICSHLELPAFFFPSL